MLKSSQQFDIGNFVSESNQIKNIPIDMLVEYHNHQFKLYSGERLEDMVESIRQNGILNPILVQPLGNTSKYEILSGHNRVAGAKAVGLLTIPAVVKENLSEEEAEIYVIETNLMQRGFNDLFISEQAHVLKLQHSKLFSQGKRNDIIAELERLESGTTSSPLGKKLNGNTSLHKVGDEYGLSKNTVARLLRINYLIQPFKELLDEKLMALRVGVELSYIPEDGQTMVYEVIKNYDKNINIKLSKDIRNLFATSENVSVETLKNLIVGEKNTPKDSTIKVSLTLNKNTYSKYFDSRASKNEIESTIYKALEMYFNRNKF